MTHRRLTNELHRLRQTLPANQEIASGILTWDRSRSLGKKAEDDLAEHLVLFENLVGIETLAVTQRTELHRLGDDRRLGVDVALRPFQIAGHALDEKRNVVEQLVSRENTLGRNRHPSGDPVQPLGYELLFGCPQPVG